MSNYDEQLYIHRLLTMIDARGTPELKKLAANYRRTHKLQSRAYDSKPYTKEEVVAILKTEILRKPPSERQAIIDDGKKIVEQIYADEERREDAEQNAYYERIWKTRRVVMNQNMSR